MIEINSTAFHPCYKLRCSTTRLIVVESGRHCQTQLSKTHDRFDMTTAINRCMIVNVISAKHSCDTSHAVQCFRKQPLRSEPNNERH